MLSTKAPAARPVTYCSLLAAQTAAATVLYLVVFPVFQQLITDPGLPKDIDAKAVGAVGVAVIFMQACYWVRYWRVPVWAPIRSAVLGHILLFASRASFFFGGALFSAIFFRHVPQLDALPPFWQGLAKAFVVLAVLFALFCYSLELERLGRSME